MTTVLMILYGGFPWKVEVSPVSMTMTTRINETHADHGDSDHSQLQADSHREHQSKQRKAVESFGWWANHGEAMEKICVNNG